MYACAAFRWHGNAENFYPLKSLGGGSYKIYILLFAHVRLIFEFII